MFEFLQKCTSLFGETKTWRKNEKKEEDVNRASTATVKEGQGEEENEKEEVNEDEETTEFIRKRLPFCVSSFEEFGERANRERIRPLEKRSEIFSSDAISKKRKNRKCDTVVQKPSVSESGVTTEEILDDKSRQEDNNEKGEIFTELEQEALRLELETASRRVAENSRARPLLQIDANKKHFQRHVLKERAESALRSMQKAKLLFEKTKVEEEAQREEDLTSKTSATLENGGTCAGGSQQLADLSAAFRQARVNFIARQRRYDRARALFSSNGGSKKGNRMW